MPETIDWHALHENLAAEYEREAVLAEHAALAAAFLNLAAVHRQLAEFEALLRNHDSPREPLAPDSAANVVRS